jgi:hypothetical protein
MSPPKEGKHARLLANASTVQAFRLSYPSALIIMDEIEHEVSSKTALRNHGLLVPTWVHNE